MITSFVDDGGRWLIRFDTRAGGGFIGGNVVSAYGLGLMLNVAPRAGSFELASPEVDYASMLVMMNDTDIPLMTMKESLDGGFVYAGGMTLNVTAVDAARKGTVLLHGSVKVELADAQQALGTATFQATF
jgi:hypothetical protein